MEHIFSLDTSTYQLAYLPIYPPTYLPAYLRTYLSIHLSTYLIVLHRSCVREMRSGKVSI